MNNILFKFLVSVVITFLVASGISILYYNIPIHMVCNDNATDYIWERNTSYIDVTEGFSYGKTNNEGYFNIDNYTGQRIDVLIMGSSHMQGMSVIPEDNIANKLKEATDLTVYNIGTTGHNIKVCISNLEAALNKYNPGIVVIETDRIILTDDEIKNTLNKNIDELSSIEGGVIGFLQRNPFIRWSYTQIQSFINNSKVNDNDNKNDSYFNYELTNTLIEYIRDIADKCKTKVIIMYHPSVSIEEDGSLNTTNDFYVSNSFEEMCNNNGIYFLNMNDRYLSEYKKDYTVPTGFINTGVATGHINEYGHKMMAEELTRLIQGMDE